MSSHARSWRHAAAVYGAALVAGLVLVGFPASATLLKDRLELDDAAYGAIFLPQVIFAIAGSVAGAALARRVGTARLLLLALGSFALAELALFAAGAMGEYALLLAATAFGGLGFGLAAAPFNTYPGELFPKRRDAALVALHTVVGGGFAVGPVVVGALVSSELWSFFSLGLVALALGAGLLAIGLPSIAIEPAPRAKGAATRGPLAGFLVIAVLYAFAEGTFANWGSVFLHEERSIGEADSALALAVFWAALSIGRLAVSAILVRVPARTVWIALPIAMALSFVAIPLARDALGGLVVFALAGLSCSAFFPLTVGLAVELDRTRAAPISSAMTAALMLGVGLGSFVVGPLREAFTLGELYWISTGYPIAVLVIAFAAGRSSARRAARV